MYINAKRKDNLLDKVNAVVSSEHLTDEQKAVINELAKAYENSTYDKWSEKKDYDATVLEDMVNNTLFDSEFVASKMARMHPTLQQSFMRLCVAFIKEMSAKTYSDGRNEAAVTLAKSFYRVIEEENNAYLPHI